MDNLTHIPSIYSLQGRTVLVTGASSGIGAACALAFAGAGAQLIVTGRDDARLSKVFEALPAGRHQKIQAELTNEDELIGLVNQCPDLHGVVHCAGISKTIPISLSKYAQNQEVFLINYMSTVSLTQKLLRAKKITQGGSIVFLSSIAAVTGTIGLGLYAGSKAGLIGVSRPLALEAAKYKIRVNVICPGIVKTPIFGEDVALIEERTKNYPLGYGLSEDVANACMFYLSDASKKITGTVFNIDGGVSST